MESSKKLRIFGGVITTLAMLYYSYEIYLYTDNWYSKGDIQEDTACGQVYALELWLLSQNIIWLISLLILLVVLVHPDFYKLLLCFLYFMGPVYLTWTLVAVGYFSAFLACCRDEEDGCTDYYPYASPAGFIALIIVNLILSSLVTLYLLSLVAQALWIYIRQRYQHYINLLI